MAPLSESGDDEDDTELETLIESIYGMIEVATEPPSARRKVTKKANFGRSFATEFTETTKLYCSC